MSGRKNKHSRRARYKVLVSAPYMQTAIERFREMCERNDIELIIQPVKERLEEEILLQCMGDIDGVICGDDRFTERVLASAPRLKVISKWGTGIDSIDRAACQRHGVTVCNTPDAFTDPVADTVFGYVLCFARGLPLMDREMKSGIWRKPMGRALQECMLGVIGVGRIGKAVARRAVGFGMTVLGNDPVAMPADFLKTTGIQMTPKLELLRKADFVTLNCDLNPTSFHLMSDHEFKVMKSTACIINTARGPLMDECALVKALETKRIAGAALDVYETEPLPGNSPLRRMDNVMLAPHNANNSPEAWERVHQNTVENLIRELKPKE